ncbi:hypothetical protein NQ318_004455 [Aromia moschata]|uniref:Uncharacterized protein n=1 Tax=Aromia moschata TaxID=1265417 RepID=A0AAV8YCS8_9CUCU|nr:hypothetical protein NQ318_004455 [Aromia moschata]
MNHISVLEMYLDKLVYRKLLCTELSGVIYYTHIIFKKCKNCYRKIWLDEGITNLHNYYEYFDINPHSVTPRHFQREFKINVWIGIIDRIQINGLDDEIIAHKFGLHDHQTSTNVTSFFGGLASRAELWNRITDKCNIIRNNQRLLERVDFNIRRRINLCLRENGDHFEQFL